MKTFILPFIFSTFIFVTGCTLNAEEFEDTNDNDIKTVHHDKINGIESTPNFVQQSDFLNIDWERKAVKFGHAGIIGNENKSGILGADTPRVNSPQKWMWHLWGVPSNVDLTVVGFHRETQTVHQILTDHWTKGTSGPHNGADAHVPSTVKIPMEGEWAIMLYIDGELFDILIFEINK